MNLTNSGLKASKDILVVMKDIRKNLFYLHNITVNSGVSLASHISGTDDTSRL